METMIPKTYEEAKAQGYSVAFLRYQRGYISRNANIDKVTEIRFNEQEVLIYDSDYNSIRRERALEHIQILQVFP